MINIDKINELMDSIKDDVVKLETKGVKSAAPRIRKALMGIGRACKAGRVEAQELKSNFGKTPEPEQPAEKENTPGEESNHGEE